MTSIQIAPRSGRVPLSIAVAIVAAAFALGAVIGYGLPRLLDGANTAMSAVTGASVAVAPGGSSDAAYDTRTEAAAVRSASIASRDMSDAAYDARIDAARSVVIRRDRSRAAHEAAIHGLTPSTMSDAAYAATHRASDLP